MSRATALAPSYEAPWQDLPRELVTRILARLPTNEVPCTARLVCKAAAAALCSPAHTTVRLSQPSPHGAFVRRWGAPGAMRPLTLDRRRRLLCLAAASGCLHNLTWLVEHAGCLPDGRVFEAAAAAGRPEACRWLYRRQGHNELLAGLAAAAGAGQRSTLEALLADPGVQNLPSHIVDDLGTSLVTEAARGGHVGLMDWLAAQFRPPRDAFWADDLLAAAAAGCDLRTLHRLCFAHLPRLAWLERENPGSLCLHVGSAAASSRTPDWRAKVEWVEVCLGAPLNTNACAGAAACPDALERLAWLRARGCPWDRVAVEAAAGAGNVEALSYLLAEGCELHISALRAAAAGGHLAALEVLHSHGLTTAASPGVRAYAAAAAARGGQLPVVRWMLERQLIELQPLAPRQMDESLIGAAAESGSIELMALLHAGGCPWGELDLYAAARGGSEEALEWAVVHGYPVQASTYRFSDPYFFAAEQGDWGTLVCLGRLAIPWRPLNRDGTFRDAVECHCSMPILRRLLELGCPVDWRRTAKVCRGENMRAWLKEEQRRREVVGVPQQR